MSDKEFPKKFANKLPPGFEDAANSMSNEDLKKKIVECEGHIYKLERAKSEDAALSKAKEEVKEISLPYSEGRASENAKIKFCMYLLEGRGQEI